MISTGMFNNFRIFNDVFSLEYVIQLQSFRMVAYNDKRLVALLHLHTFVMTHICILYNYDINREKFS